MSSKNGVHSKSIALCISAVYLICHRCLALAKDLDSRGPQWSHAHTWLLLELYSLKLLWDNCGIIDNILVSYFSCLSDVTEGY